MITLDFETEAIVSGSDRSPTPVGLAIRFEDGGCTYLSWRHPTENNSTLFEVKEVVRKIIDSDEFLLFHNAKFDVRILMEHFDVPYPAKRVHDSMFLAFLYDPRESSLGLKYLADKYLNMPPDEQEELRDWLVANVKGVTEKNFGAHISKAPGDLVGRYAIGDVERTYQLYCYYMDKFMEEQV